MWELTERCTECEKIKQEVFLNVKTFLKYVPKVREFCESCAECQNML